MIDADALVLLDTNVCLHLLRAKAAGAWIDREYRLSARPERPLLSVVSVGELLRIGSRIRAAWGAARQRRLAELRHELVLVDVGTDDVLRKYAEIGAYLDDHGLTIPQNDVWIAAVAAAKGAVLLTTDTDFDRLHSGFLTREFINPDLLPRD